MAKSSALEEREREREREKEGTVVGHKSPCCSYSPLPLEEIEVELNGSEHHPGLEVDTLSQVRLVGK